MHIFATLKQIKAYWTARTRRGSSLILFTLVFGTITVSMIVLGIAQYALTEYKASIHTYNRDVALHIAEAGIQYYRWHLAHDSDDYTDGTGGLSGPYEHEFYDKNGDLLGYFSLEITAPASGSTIVGVRSTGWTINQPQSSRTISVRLGFPALTDYAFIQNGNMSFSPTTQVHGKVHSNGGIEFNGVTDAPIESSRTTYVTGGQTRNGVWGAGGPQAFWNFPVPAKDFVGITADLTAIRDLAQNGGLYFNSTGQQGYQVVFMANGTFQLYRIRNVDCYNGYNLTGSYTTMCFDERQSNRVNLGNYAIPSNGALFFEDHVWVEGVVDGRVTLAAGRFPVVSSQYRNIYISNNLTYEQKSSDDVLGLIAQGYIIVPHNVPTDMEINAAALSQFRSIYRPQYRNNGNGGSTSAIYATRNSLLFFGSQISYETGGWKYGSGSNIVSGFINTNHTYDGNLLYTIPPGFPVGETYELISWEEIL
jgi:hypothetical protein